MTDSKRLPDPSQLISRLPQGSAVIVRHETREGKIDLIHKIKKLCAKHKVKLLISDDVSLALSLRLDGVHLSEKTLKKTALCGRFIKPKAQFFVTSACHSLKAIKWAEICMIDAVLISPVFATKSHPDGRTLGTWKFANLARKGSIKKYALGGITSKTISHLRKSKACGCAGIGELI